MPDQPPATIAELLGLGAKKLMKTPTALNAPPAEDSFEKMAKTYLANFARFVHVAQTNGANGLSENSYALLFEGFLRWKQG